MKKQVTVFFLDLANMARVRTTINKSLKVKPRGELSLVFSALISE